MNHPAEAGKFLKDTARAHWHDETLWMVRKKRDTAVSQVPDWEQLRDLASGIKDNVLSNLADYLEEFERNAIAKGIIVRWAEDAEDHNRIVEEILLAHEVKTLVKSKSILTEECHLNPYLEARGFEVVDSDLGERIVQFAKQPPSHIVMPAIHLKKREIGDIFHEHLGTEAGNEDPVYLTRAARHHLREKFLTAGAALTGVNFAIAETGGFVVCTNEGNADMGVHLAPVHIASMGIEKIIPKAAHLGVFTRLLARSATGQAITNYTSHFHGPRKGQMMYLILVDNGRTTQLSREHFRNSLKCIRCGACMNTCPVYRRSGGFSYGSTVPGPIGSILSPGLDPAKFSTLPFASTLCGSCSDVCPVRINIHDQLYRWRQEVVNHTHAARWNRVVMRLASGTFSTPSAYRRFSRIAGTMMRIPGMRNIIGRLSGWGRSRELPVQQPQTFREWFERNRKQS
ncbi:MAG: lactate utilization protein B [Bacteroidota bacterium]